MASNRTGRGNETSATESSDRPSGTVPTTRATHQRLNCSIPSDAPSVRPRGACPSRSSHKSKMTASTAGSGSEHTMGCVPTQALPSTPTTSPVCAAASDHYRVIDSAATNVAHTSRQRAEVPRCSHVGASSTSTTHATAQAMVGDVRRPTNKGTTDIKIASTTSKHTVVPLTDTRQTRTRTPTTATVTAASACGSGATNAQGQLAKQKAKITSTSNTTTTTTTTVTTAASAASSIITVCVQKSVASSAATAGEASCSYDTARRSVHSASAHLTSTTSARISPSTMVGNALTAAVDVKSKFTENKCQLAVPATVSNQRKVEANSKIPATEQQRKLELSESDNKPSTSKNISASTSREASNRGLLAGESSASTRYDPAHKTSAHHTEKSLLKPDLFKSKQVNEAVNQCLTQKASLSDITGAKEVTRSGETHQPAADAAAKELPKIHVEPSEVGSTASQRILALKQKFEQLARPTSSYQRRSKLQLKSAVKVQDLVQLFERQPKVAKRKRMIVQPKKTCENVDITMSYLRPDSNPIPDEGCNLVHSAYSSDSEDKAAIAKLREAIAVEKVMRTAISDSAVVVEGDECMDTTPVRPPVGFNQKRRSTLTVTDLPLRPALLPLAEPTTLPDTTPIELPSNALYNSPPEVGVLSEKILLEERVIELPEDPRTLTPSQPCSRRESTQSCVSDTMPTEFPAGKRYVRTPSVVVSDYSDDVLGGITFEEMEYIRAQGMSRRHSSLDTGNDGEGDVSTSSSCSNLNYCGSTISALDGNECFINGIRTSLGRKSSDSSITSANVEEEPAIIPEDPQVDLSELLDAQHLTPKPPTTQVGFGVPPLGEHFNENINI